MVQSRFYTSEMKSKLTVIVGQVLSHEGDIVGQKESGFLNEPCF